MHVVPVRKLGMGEDEEESFKHQRERSGQEGPEGWGESSPWGSQGSLRCWDDCPYGLAEVTRPQDDRSDIQFQFDTAAVDLGVPAT